MAAPQHTLSPNHDGATPGRPLVFLRRHCTHEEQTPLHVYRHTGAAVT